MNKITVNCEQKNREKELQYEKDIAKRVAKWPRGYSYLADQIKRAMISSVLNLCEGNGKTISSTERRRFFQISMGSIAEVSAGLDLAKTFHLINPNDQDRLKSYLKAAYVKIKALP